MSGEQEEHEGYVDDLWDVYCDVCGWNIRNTGCAPGYCANACAACGGLDECEPGCEG